MSEKEMNRDPNDPNKGLNVRTFSYAVVVALVLILSGLMFMVVKERGKIVPDAAVPRATSAASPQ